MALTSALFRGNRALQACAVEDSAHVTRGAVGEHVAKIQFALFAIDGLLIARSEIAMQQYGGSTAAAVLAYKKRRAIINRSYQTTADDIVGKMTIASLDKDIRVVEARPKTPGDCGIAPAGAPALVSQPGAGGSAKGVAPGARGLTTANPQLNAVVRIMVQITQRASLENGFPLAAHLDRARNCLGEHGITLSVEFGNSRNAFADTLKFSDVASSTADSPLDNMDELRKSSEDARPGVPGVLRMIVCPMVGSHFGDTFRNRVIGGRRVPPFVVLNSRLDDRSHATLIHEMIHASKGGLVPHDGEKSSVFFEFGTESQGDPERTALRAEHAATIATMGSRM